MSLVLIFAKFKFEMASSGWRWQFGFRNQVGSLCQLPFRRVHCAGSAPHADGLKTFGFTLQVGIKVGTEVFFGGVDWKINSFPLLFSRRSGTFSDTT